MVSAHWMKLKFCGCGGRGDLMSCPHMPPHPITNSGRKDIKKGTNFLHRDRGVPKIILSARPLAAQ
jgi:hypothetical protein